jgi:hypothetical protein
MREKWFIIWHQVAPHRAPHLRNRPKLPGFGPMNATFDRDAYSTNQQAVMFDLMAELYPICRSITGNGVRKNAANPAEEPEGFISTQ